METQEAELLLSTELHGSSGPNTSLKIEGSKEGEEKEEVMDLTQSSEDEEMPDPPVDSAEDRERSESEMSKDVGPQGSSKMTSGDGEVGVGEVVGGEVADEETGGGEGGAGRSGRHGVVSQSVRQEATAIVMDKALRFFATGIQVRGDTKNVLKDRTKTFLVGLLGRHELADSMDPEMVRNAIAGWIAKQGDVGEKMRSVTPSPPKSLSAPPSSD